MKLSRLEKLLDTSICGEDIAFQSVSIDSRTLQPGALFIAIQGENFDGHDFVDQASKKGATALVVSKQVDSTLPQLLVHDTRKALGKIAAYHRQQFALPVVALTGSNGKTTTKEMIAAILRGQGNVLATQGNLNNDLGAPLTLLKLNAQHQYAVIELGANHMGEIAYSSQCTKPTVALITNVSAAHTAGFGNVQNVATEKAEIYRALGNDGIAIINRDESFSSQWLELNHHRNVVTFGLNNKADFTAHNITINGEGYAHFQLISPVGNCDIQLSLPGLHNVMNATAAAAAAIAAGANLDTVKIGLSQVPAVNGRLRINKIASGTRLIDDTYNANPASVKAAIHFLSQFPGKKILVLGDMGELGEQARNYHTEMGEIAKSKGITLLYTCGDLSQYATKAFGVGAQHFSNKLDLITVLKPQLSADVSCLVKGSRSAKMEIIVSQCQD